MRNPRECSGGMTLDWQGFNLGGGDGGFLACSPRAPVHGRIGQHSWPYLNFPGIAHFLLEVCGRPSAYQHITGCACLFIASTRTIGEKQLDSMAVTVSELFGGLYYILLKHAVSVASAYAPYLHNKSKTLFATRTTQFVGGMIIAMAMPALYIMRSV